MISHSLPPIKLATLGLTYSSHVFGQLCLQRTEKYIRRHAEVRRQLLDVCDREAPRAREYFRDDGRRAGERRI